MTKLLMLLVLPLVPADAGTFDLFNDFQSSAFSYGYTTTLEGTFHPYTVTDTTSHPGAIALLRSGTFTPNPPYVAKNTTGSALNIGASFLMPASMLDVHPGSAGEDTVVRLTMPAGTTGQYTITGMFTGIDTTTTDVHIFDNSLSIFSSNIDGQGATAPFSLVVTLAPGDILDFAVGFGSNNNFFFDSTGIQGTIASLPATGVPEPASGLLLLTGIAAVAAAGRSRRGRRLGL